MPRLFRGPIGGVPKTISGLQLWVRSDAGLIRSGGAVRSWLDQSGQRRHLATSGGAPTLIENALAGRAAVRFDGAADAMSSAAFSVSQPLTIFLIVNLVTMLTNGAVIHCGTSTTNTAPQVRYTTTDLRLLASGLQGATVATSPGSFMLVKAVFNGASSVLSLNAGADVTDPDNLAGNFTQVHVAARAAADLFAHVDIAEIAIYNSAISGADLTAFNGYVSSRYGIF